MDKGIRDNHSQPVRDDSALVRLEKHAASCKKCADALFDGLGEHPFCSVGKQLQMEERKEHRQAKTPKTRLCEECRVNPAKFRLINGDEKRYLCEPDFEDTVVEIITNNALTTFHSPDHPDAKILTVEVG